MPKKTKQSLIIFFILGSLTAGLIYHNSKENIQRSSASYSASDKGQKKSDPVIVESQEVSSPDRSAGPKNISEKDYQVYFSQVYGGNHRSVKSNPLSMDHQLARVLARAKKHIYCAVQELDSDVFANALLSAHRRGVLVKIVTEDRYREEAPLIRLVREGIPVVDDSDGSKRTTRLMHNKFIVVDKEWVWTGSANTTYNGFYKNNNNAVLIRSRELAANFLDEFNEMFDRKSFGLSSPDRIPHKVVRLNDGTIVQTLFAPENNVAMRIIQELKKARRSIHFMAFSFTHKDIGEVMLKKHLAGVKVMGIFEKRMAGKYSRFKHLRENGIETVKTDRNKYNMHHKVIIIDEKTVITGSYNFSENADKRNDENILIIHSPQIAKSYLEEFYRLYPSEQ